MSASARPLIADVIPLIDLLHDRLDELVNNTDKPMIIRASAAKASAIIEKYYSKTDDSKMYCLCMSKPFVHSCEFKSNKHTVLHPRYKCTYFVKVKWHSDWINTANQMIRQEWEDVYKPTIDPSFSEGVAELGSKDSVCIQFVICCYTNQSSGL